MRPSGTAAGQHGCYVRLNLGIRVGVVRTCRLMTQRKSTGTLASVESTVAVDRDVQ